MISEICMPPGDREKAVFALFDRLCWRDPVNRTALEPIVTARTPAGVPICGVLRSPGKSYAYPIVDCVARMTPELAQRHAAWLQPLGLRPPSRREDGEMDFQSEATVDSFGFQWEWNSAMRSEADLLWRVAERFKMTPADFKDKIVLDAGAGAGDQSRWLLDQGARVVSIDLSSAIGVVANKLRMRAGWVGVQGDITVLPFAENQFDIVYCEGVIQHTRNSASTVRELCRVLRRHGLILATHYAKSRSWLGRAALRWREFLRRRLSRGDRYKLLWLTGNLAAFSYVPLLGHVLRRTTVPYYALMPDFRTTWTNTFDAYGNHTYQRYVSSEEFWRFFEEAGKMERVYQQDTVIVARKT